MIEENIEKEAINRSNAKCEICGIKDKKYKNSSKLLKVCKINNDEELSMDNCYVACLTCEYKINELDEKSYLEDIKAKRVEEKNITNNMSSFVKEAVFKSKEFEKKVEQEVNKMNKKCNEDINEANKARSIEKCIQNILEVYGIEYEPILEGNLKIEKEERVIKRNKNKKIVNKRFDARFHEVVFEYKKNILNNLDENKKQLVEYLQQIVKDEKRKLDEFFGVLTDGNRVVFVSFENDELQYSAVKAFTPQTMKEILKVFLSLERKKLTPHELSKDFSINKSNSEILDLSKKFYYKLMSSCNVLRYDEDWKKIFKLGGHNDNNNKAILDRKEALANYFDVSSEDIDESKALFSLQTSYCILLKLIAYRVMCTSIFNSNGMRFEELLALKPNTLKIRMKQIESGSIFTDINISNLMTNDFFSWYLEDEIWDETIFKGIRDCINILKDYDSSQKIFSNDNTHDLFNELYQSIIPKEVRHSLGEYYTPDWLADSVIRPIITKKISDKFNWRGLDPCSGSGTFVMRMIDNILEYLDEDATNIDKLNEIINRVYAIDINPLAVLTCRVNYFVAISSYLELNSLLDGNGIYIPVFLGDSALIPKRLEIKGIRCIKYTFDEIEFVLPETMILKNEDVMTLQRYIENNDREKIKNMLSGDNIDEVLIVEDFIENIQILLNRGYNKIWIRTILGILKSINIGKFDIIVSNPPWIDWKVLPPEYREILKTACLDTHVFSGDNFTGGINLNICALIANVVADNWLKIDGEIGLLMPKSIALQQSYKGFRDLQMSNGGALEFDYFVDWSKSGNPFKPVTEKFMTYYLKKTESSQQKEDIKCFYINKKRNVKLKNVKTFDEAEDWFEIKEGKAHIIDKNLKNFTFIEDSIALDYDYSKIIGESEYTGRVGLGIYPKGVLLFEIDNVINESIVKIKTYTDKRVQKKYPQQERFLETKYLYPVIEGPNINKFGISDVKYYAALPYDISDTKKPICLDKLKENSKNLASFYESNKEYLKKTDWNERLQGKKGEFYSLTRVGKYTFAPYKVVFRNNTKWLASVVSNYMTTWKEEKMFIMLDHACSISQRSDGEFITEDEAHYICAIINAPIVRDYIEKSSDSRSFKTKFPIKIDRYDEKNDIHKKLSQISKKAHNKEISNEEVDYELEEILKQYMN